MRVFGDALARLTRAGTLTRLYLQGSLGAGKTSMARHVLRSLGVTERIKSPSFAVAETYHVAGLDCAHLDLFRQTDPRAWRDSGLRELFTEMHLVLVEWPEKANDLPAPDIALTIDWADPDLPEGPRRLQFLCRSTGVQAELQSAIEDVRGGDAITPTSTPSSTPKIDRLRRGVMLGPIAAGFLAGVPRPSEAVEVSAVRVWPAQNYTRIAIEHDTPKLFFSTTRLTRPERLVVDLQHMRLGHALRQIVARIQPNDPFIGQVRVGQFKPHVVRMVFDLKQPVRAQVFTLPPIARYQHRLVIDLYPEVAADPLLAFLKEYEAAAARRRNEVLDKLPPTETARAPAPAPSAPAPAPTSPTAPPARPPAASSFITIAIDAGHGGEDPGAIGRGGTREKDVVLRIAREMKRQIDARPNMRAFLTRDGDFFVPLARRVALARQVNADLFVSVHADAWVSPTAQGASVFALSDKGATSAAARWMANKENESDSIGGVKLGEIDDLLSRTLLDMSTTAQIKDSLRLGQSVLTEIGKINRLHKPTVEQAAFAVLRAPDIPSILVETAFISNPEEERRLRDAAYQRAVAVAIQSGIDGYLARHPRLAKKART